MRLLGPRFVSPIVAPVRARSRGRSRARDRRTLWPGLTLTPMLDTLLALVLVQLSQFYASGEL
jgi:hypothetical protein